ncbi:MAG: hypothetical protein NTV21_17725 [Planctomycetota bacterium]|nr:hypothetical protein [Planctomycetota bacterium]
MRQVVELASDGACVRIDVFHYERPASTDPDDANWIVCEVSVSAPGVRAKTQASLRTFELAEFERGLRAALTAQEGDAHFESLEEWLELNVNLRKTGRARVRATLKTHAPAVACSLTFDCDQAALCLALEQLTAALAAFPVRR